MEKLICPHCSHEFCETCFDLIDALPYRRCCVCNKASEDRDWRKNEDADDRVAPRHWRGVGWDSSKH